MPTPLAYGGILYSLNNDGVFDAYDAETGTEIYRQRLEPIGSGFSASPSAAGRADLRVRRRRRDLRDRRGTRVSPDLHELDGELLMATPALSDGVMYVRSSSALFAIGTNRK